MAPPRDQLVYLPQWRRLYDRLLKMLREEHALAEELSVERAHLIAELMFQRNGRREREEIFRTRIEQIWRDEERRKRVEKAEREVLIGGKDLESRCYQKLAELADSDTEDLRSFISTLTAENSELKAKLKEAESQVQLNENNVDHQHSGKDLRVELRKLKQAYKTLSSEKDRQISALTAEKDFVWNQFKTMEQEYIVTIKNKNIEAKEATEAAHKLQHNVHELQEAAQKKDDEIARLQAEVTNAKEKMLVLEDELQQMHSLVKARDAEAGKNKDDQPETSRKSKKDIKGSNRKSQPETSRKSKKDIKGSNRKSQPETSRKSKKDIEGSNRKSKSEGPLSKEKSRTSQVTPDRRDVKTSRTRASESSQKRKRGSSISCGSRRCSTRPLQVNAAVVSPMLLPPSFTVPKLKTPTPP